MTHTEDHKVEVIDGRAYCLDCDGNIDNVFKRYREVKDQIAKLEDQKEELELAVMEEMDQDGAKEKNTPFGSFFVMGRTTYTYSSKIIELQENLKKAKKIEENDGSAVIKSSTQHIRLVIPKEAE